jgi:hypothetical protein
MQQQVCEDPVSISQFTIKTPIDSEMKDKGFTYKCCRFRGAGKEMEFTV